VESTVFNWHTLVNPDPALQYKGEEQSELFMHWRYADFISNYVENINRRKEAVDSKQEESLQSLSQAAMLS
jgi:hypothetical protein